MVGVRAELAEEAVIDKTVLRMCESNLLRAEAALERHTAAKIRANIGTDEYHMRPDPDADALHANIAEAKADLLEAQADYVLHHHEPEEGQA